MNKLILVFAIVALISSCSEPSPTSDALRNKIQTILSDKNAIVGVSVIGPDGKDTLSINGTRHCPMQSVFKMHIALAVLAEVDKGRMSLSDQIAVRPSELLPDLWSPLRDEHPEGGTFTIERLIQYAVSQSDNVACDVLIRVMGGPEVISNYFTEMGFKDFQIEVNEQQMQSQWDQMQRNWTTANTSSLILSKFHDRKTTPLSEQTYAFFWETMKATSTGEKRLKGLLPQGTVVAHKTGTSDATERGLTPATNDIGVIYLPDGSPVIISVFVADSKENEETNERIIAELAKAVYDNYTK
jgi:beta-lactamase class A/beta-lactamase class A VEB